MSSASTPCDFAISSSVVMALLNTLPARGKADQLDRIQIEPLDESVVLAASDGASLLVILLRAPGMEQGHPCSIERTPLEAPPLTDEEKVVVDLGSQTVSHGRVTVAAPLLDAEPVIPWRAILQGITITGESAPGWTADTIARAVKTRALLNPDRRRMDMFLPYSCGAGVTPIDMGHTSSCARVRYVATPLSKASRQRWILPA